MYTQLYMSVHCALPQNSTRYLALAPCHASHTRALLSITLTSHNSHGNGHGHGYGAASERVPQSVSLICVEKSGRSPGKWLPSSFGFGDFFPAKKPAIFVPGLFSGSGTGRARATTVVCTGAGMASSLVFERNERELE